MQRITTTVVVVLACAVGLAVTGCGDELKAKDAHIALIEDTNQRLTEDLAAAQRRAEALAAERDQAHQQMLAAQRERDGLRGQLASRPEPQPAPPGWEAVPGGAMIAVPGSVLFASGKAELRNANSSDLDAIASTIRSEYPTKDIFVFGHTDDVPIRKSGWKDNYELSAQRALSVVRYLGERGIDYKRLIACGAGEYRPRVPNSGGDSRKQNRRVEIFAVEPIN